MEVKEEYDEKVNLIDLLLPGSSERNFILYGENVQSFPSPTHLSSLSPDSLRAAHTENDSKEVLRQLVLPLRGLKKEKYDEEEEENSHLGSLEEDNCGNNSDSQELPSILSGSNIKHEVKEEITEETQEIDSDDTSHGNENDLIDTSPEQSIASPEKPSSNHLSRQCQSCKYVFGVLSSLMNHKKICKESNSICRTNVESDVDKSVAETTQKETRSTTASFRFACCEKVFTKFTEFNYHKYCEHKIGYLICGLCKYKVGIARNLYEHYKECHFPGINILIDDSVNEISKPSKPPNPTILIRNSTVPVSVSQNNSTSNPDLLQQCQSCNTVFGVLTSIMSHKKICKESNKMSESDTDKSVAETTQKEAGSSTPFRFACCETVFTKFTEFNYHKFSEHKIGYISCGLCRQKVGIAQNLCEHYKECHFPGINILIDDSVNEGIVRKPTDMVIIKRQCPKCGKPINKANKARHLKICGNQKPIVNPQQQCPSCSAPITLPNMNRHMKRCCPERLKRTATGLREYYYRTIAECTAKQQGILCQCSSCSSQVSKNMSNKTTVQKRFECTVCGQGFHYKNRLKEHEKTHSGIKSFPCNICAMSFTKRLTLDRHMLTQHSSEASPFKVSCDICSKQLSCRSSLTKHVRNVHLRQVESVTRISCPHCPKTLADSKSLSRHIKNHLQKTEYICADCNRVFYTKENLTNHIKSQHLPQEPIKCELCEYVATSKVNLNVHKSKVHYDWRYNCEICGKRFPLRQNLETHRVMHFDEKPFVCQACGKGFKRESNLEQHMHTHSNVRSHLCTICGLSFRLRTHVKQHMAVHGIEKNHKCLVCKKLFARKKELNVHMSTHDVTEFD